MIDHEAAELSQKMDSILVGMFLPRAEVAMRGWLGTEVEGLASPWYARREGSDAVVQ
jgi:hypothetical protein